MGRRSSVGLGLGGEQAISLNFLSGKSSPLGSLLIPAGASRHSRDIPCTRALAPPRTTGEGACLQVACPVGGRGNVASTGRGFPRRCSRATDAYPFLFVPVPSVGAPRPVP